MSISELLGAAVFAVAALLIFWAHDRWYVPWRARRYALQVLKDIQSGKKTKAAKPRKSDHRITLDSIGLTLTQRKIWFKESVTMRWDEVESVTAFKRDLSIVDCVCLFLASRNGAGIELDEEMLGWEEFGRAMPEYLPGCKKSDEWFLAVAFPAFATNMTSIYSRRMPQSVPAEEMGKGPDHRQ